MICILEWSLEYQGPRTCNTGDALTVPAGAVQAVPSVGSGNAAELAMDVVEKGKPVIALAG